MGDAMNVHVLPVEWRTHADALRRIREQVFIVEQQVPKDLEWDDEDEQALHVLAVNEAGQPLGCARLLASGQIGRMAVLADQRGTGLGRRLLDEAIEQAKSRGLARVHLHAQTQAVGFYRKAGFLPEGGEFMEAGIPHQTMSLALPLPFESSGPVARPVVRPEAPEAPPPGAGLTQYRGESECRAALLEALGQPRRSLLVLSQHLDHVLFDAADVVAAFSAFARTSPNATIRILISDSSAAVSRGHRLVELARRLDSRIEIRKVADDSPPGDGSFVAWDDQGFWLMPDYRDYLAARDLYDPVQASRLRDAFDQLWARAHADPELRLLTL